MENLALKLNSERFYLVTSSFIYVVGSNLPLTCFSLPSPIFYFNKSPFSSFPFSLCQAFVFLKQFICVQHWVSTCKPYYLLITLSLEYTGFISNSSSVQFTESSWSSKSLSHLSQSSLTSLLSIFPQEWINYIIQLIVWILEQLQFLKVTKNVYYQPQPSQWTYSGITHISQIKNSGPPQGQI